MGREDVTQLVKDLASGAPEAGDRLLSVVYDELRQLAHHHRAHWRGAGLGTQSLVHEAYLKLVVQTNVDWQSRAQFFAIASRAMRSVLADNARHWQRLKREGRRQRVDLDERMLVSEARSEEVIALDLALERLQEADPGLAAIVECRFFGGLTVEETAEARGVSAATVKRHWAAARTWLYRELQGSSEDPEPAAAKLSS